VSIELPGATPLKTGMILSWIHLLPAGVAVLQVPQMKNLAGCGVTWNYQEQNVHTAESCWFMTATVWVTHLWKWNRKTFGDTNQNWLFDYNRPNAQSLRCISIWISWDVTELKYAKRKTIIVNCLSLCFHFTKQMKCQVLLGRLTSRFWLPALLYLWQFWVRKINQKAHTKTQHEVHTACGQKQAELTQITMSTKNESAKKKNKSGESEKMDRRFWWKLLQLANCER